MRSSLCAGMGAERIAHTSAPNKTRSLPSLDLERCHVDLALQPPRGECSVIYAVDQAMMTIAATVMGHLPLVFARGPGARNSIGIMLVTIMLSFTKREACSCYCANGP